MSGYTQIIYEVREAVAHVTLNRPDKRNALGEVIVRELKQAVGAAEADGAVRVVVLRGAGKDFSAGADLAHLEKISQNSVLENLADAAALAELFLQLRRLAKPVIAAVRGRALAGGAGLASACDLVIAARSAQFCYTEVRIGFVPAMVAAIARRNLSEKRAFEWLTTARTISAEEAASAGFVNRVSDDADFEAEVEKFAAELTAVSASAVMLTKRLLYQMDALSFEQALRAGVDANVMARMTEDCRAGVGKFLRKE
jgi:methylglutaconyl-CoA hydratase